MYRIGTGFDVHKFDVNRRLILGGVHIPYDEGLLGHSDADVLIHAIMDAILGAAGLCDIGTYFPDDSVEYKDVSSLNLLNKVNKLLLNKGYCIVNIDSTIIAQKPKLKSYIDDMKKNIAMTLGIDVEYIGIKATTTEQLGFTGREEGIAAQAATLIQKIL